MFVIDRFEGNWAVIEFGEIIFCLPRNILPKDAKEGNIISINIKLAKELEKNQKNKIENLSNDLFK